MEKLGEMLKKIRKEHNLTQVDLAKQLNMVSTTYSSYEQDITEPSIDTLKILSKVYNCSIDELVGNEINQREMTKIQQEILSIIYLLNTQNQFKLLGYAHALLSGQ